MGSKPLVRPPRLARGSRVALVAPAGPLLEQDDIARAEALCRALDYGPVLGPHAGRRHGYLAGTDEERLDDLNAALADPQVRAVVCTRGGYGVQRIVDGLDLYAVRADPKVVVGFSDITALQLALWRAARLATVHGPGAAWLDERTGPEAAESLRRAVMVAEPIVLKARQDEQTSAVRVTAPAGPVRGLLLGGNLSLLCSTVGTRDQPDLRGAILLLEDVEEPPYKVDRMLLHLRRAGCLAGVAGVAVGQFTDCADGFGVGVAEVLADHLGSLGVPVLGGLPVGHGRDQLTVPVGVPATLDVAAGTLTTEPAVRHPSR